MPLLDGLIDTHERRRSAIVETARRLGSGEIECVRERLISEDAEFTRMTQAGEFPLAYRSTRAMIAVVLREAAADGK